MFVLSLLSLFLYFKFSFSLELIQIHTITRHGQRSPCFTYPNDPYRDIWTKGLCQLTDIGVEQLKEVGSYLKQKYHNIIPDNFHKKRVYVKSSDTDRTIISALAAMKTIFKNQIIPIHTVPKRYDYLLKMSSICPHHKNRLTEEFQSEKYGFLFDEFSSLFNELKRGSEINNVDIYLALRICDSIIIWNQLNLTFPIWLSQSSVSKCQNLLHWKFIISYSNNELTKFRGGPLVNQIIENMSKKAIEFKNGNTGMKMINFFTHDSTMSGFLGHLNCFNQLQPPLASTIIIELYYSPINNNSYELSANFVVRFLFRNDTKKDAHILNVSFCENSFCRLDILINNFNSHVIKNIPEECGISNLIDYWFASSKSRQQFFINLSLFKHKADDDKLYLSVNILIPLIITEIIVLFLFYKLFKK